TVDAASGVEEASLRDLEAILAEESKASAVEIDPSTSAFMFCFRHDGRDVVHIGSPWVILSDLTPSEGAVCTAPAFDGQDGLVTITASDEEAADDASDYAAVHRATGLVWRQYILRAFDRSVSAGRVALYAREQTVAAEFQLLPADVWPLLNVIDW